MNKDSYHPYKLELSSGLMDSFVDATYVLTLCNSNRIDNIIEQFKKVKPTKTIYIFFNEGYKNKKLRKKDSINDICDTNIHIFHHANERNYKNILVLEDDFIFDDKIKDKKKLDSIERFINIHDDKIFAYSLGSLSVMLYPIFEDTYLTLSLGAHSHIYNKKTRDHLINKYRNAICDDWEWYTSFVVKRYIYKEPLCYQLFPETENSKNWKVTGIIFFIINKLFNLKTDISYQGFYTYNKIGYIMFYILLFIILLLIYIIFKKKN